MSELEHANGTECVHPEDAAPARSFAIQQIGLPGMQAVAMDIAEPGIVRHVAIGTQQRAIALHGKPDKTERVVLFVEVEPGAATRRRRFALVMPGTIVNLRESQRHEFCGVAINPATGTVIYVYEIIEAE